MKMLWVPWMGIIEQYTWHEEGSQAPLSNQVPLQFSSPSNSGLSGPPFQPPNISVQKV